MKYKLIDIGGILERMMRAGFYLGAGLYLGIKAVIIIPQNPNIPDLFASPALIVAAIGGFLLYMKVVSEPTPKQQREAKKHAEFIDKIVHEIAEDMQNGR